MILLDYKLISRSVGPVTVKEAQSLSIAELATEIFESKLIFVINDVDLSWDDDVPMVDFARSLFIVSTLLSEKSPVEEFLSPGLEPYWTLRLRGPDVEVSREGLAGHGICPLGELVRESASFGVRVYDDFLSAYPLAAKSRLLSSWYPYREMKRLSSSTV